MESPVGKVGDAAHEAIVPVTVGVMVTAKFGNIATVVGVIVIVGFAVGVESPPFHVVLSLLLQ